MWQPIETAPKDKDVLLYCPMRGVVRGRWDDCKYSTNPKPYWTHDRERLYGVRETRNDQPTHWMPLPEAPSAQAQPAPSVPDGWLPIPERHPTFDHVDLKMEDGSVLCGCIPQIDGDYWWKGPSGDVFIDPNYAPVTHWRLSVAPEAKPLHYPTTRETRRQAMKMNERIMRTLDWQIQLTERLRDWLEEGHRAIYDPPCETNPLWKRCYVMSENHLSGHRLIVGFESAADCDAAYDFVVAQRKAKTTQKTKP